MLKYPRYNEEQEVNMRGDSCQLEEIDMDTMNNSSNYSMSWPRNPELARAYVPFQTRGKLYQPIEGLSKGTIFPDLSKF